MKRSPVIPKATIGVLALTTLVIIVGIVVVKKRPTQEDDRPDQSRATTSGPVPLIESRLNRDTKATGTNGNLDRQTALNSTVILARELERKKTATTERRLNTVLAELNARLLREPATTLQLARDALNDFPDSEQAPELTWYVVRSLWELQEKAEAIAEAKRMVETYPGNRFTEDVRRHLLNAQMGLPPRTGS